MSELADAVAGWCHDSLAESTHDYGWAGFPAPVSRQILQPLRRRKWCAWMNLRGGMAHVPLTQTSSLLKQIIQVTAPLPEALTTLLEIVPLHGLRLVSGCHGCHQSSPARCWTTTATAI